MNNEKKSIRKISTSNKEYNLASGKYEWDWTEVIDRKPYRNWKLYRKNQHKEDK